MERGKTLREVSLSVKQTKQIINEQWKKIHMMTMMVVCYIQNDIYLYFLYSSSHILCTTEFWKKSNEVPA